MTPRSPRRLAFAALLLALALVLSWLEGYLPPPPIPLPLRYGFSNLAVMYALFFIDAKTAFSIAFLKSAFVLMTRGLLAASLSLAGGLLSVLSMTGLAFVAPQASYLLLSVLGAFTHNLGQYLLVRLLYLGASWAYLFPYLSLLSLASGSLTALVLRPLLPFFERLRIKTCPDPMPQPLPLESLDPAGPAHQ